MFQKVSMHPTVTTAVLCLIGSSYLTLVDATTYVAGGPIANQFYNYGKSKGGGYGGGGYSSRSVTKGKLYKEYAKPEFDLGYHYHGSEPQLHRDSGFHVCSIPHGSYRIENDGAYLGVGSSEGFEKLGFYSRKENDGLVWNVPKNDDTFYLYNEASDKYIGAYQRQKSNIVDRRRVYLIDERKATLVGKSQYIKHFVPYCKDSHDYRSGVFLKELHILRFFNRMKDKRIGSKRAVQYTPGAYTRLNFIPVDQNLEWDDPVREILPQYDQYGLEVRPENYNEEPEYYDN